MYRLRLLGGAAIESDAGPVGGTVAQRRRLALLALLAASPSGTMSRERLAAFLFPEADAARAHKGLADALHAVRRTLGRDALVGVGDELRLDPAIVPSDVGDLRSALAARDVDRAAALYRGPLLDGFFVPDAPELERWIEGERARLAGEYGRALAAAADAREAAGDAAGAVRWWRTLAAHEPDSTRVALRLVAALERSGDPLAALRHARLHGTLLREAFGVEPPAELRAVVERLQAGPAAQRTPAPPDAPPRAEDVAAARGVADAEARPFPARSSRRGVAPSARSRASAAHAAPPPTAPAGPPRRPIRRRAALVGGVAMTLALLVLLGVTTARRRAAGAPGERIRAVAVLPLENLSRDPAQDFFADGMTDALITELARLGDLRVTSRTSVMRYKDVERTLPQVARELDVDAVVEGTVLREGSRVRIAARLTRADDDGQLWAESYERDLREVLPLQSEIAGAIAAAVRARVVERPGNARAPPGSVDPRAYALYLQALHRWNEDAVTHHRQAIRELEHVVAIEPSFAPAHAALGEIYVHVDEFQGRSPEARTARASAVASIRRALELDEGLAEAHTSLAHLLMHQEEWEAGEREYRRALELNPNHAYARTLYAFHLVAQRRFDEAVEQAERAVALDPLSARTQSFAAYTLFAAGRYEEAAERWRRMLELYPSASDAMAGAARAHLHAGRADEGLAWAARAARARRPADSALTLAYAYAVAGRRAAAREALDAALRTGADALDPLHVAMTYAWVADPDRALAWLQRAMEREHGWTMFFDVDPGYDPLRDDARFVSLLRRMRLRG